MPEEQNNQIEPSEPGGIQRGSDIARRGMNAANYVRGLPTKLETEREVSGTTSDYPFEFLRNWGTPEMGMYGGEGEGEFSGPDGMAIDGNVYVADSGNHRIQVFDPQGRFLLKWGTHGTRDGQFGSLQGMAIDGDGNVYVADSGNHRIQVFDSQGRFLLKWDGGEGLNQSHSMGHSPESLAIDRANNI